MSADRGRRPEQSTFGVKDLAALAKQHLIGPVWDLLARGAWCRRQRRQLRLPGRTVVWVRGPEVQWAEWGARRGYFEVLRMDGIPYLRGIGTPIA